MRKAGIPVASSAGFTPRPRLSFGLALPTGAESTAEYLDIELARPLARAELVTLPARLTAALPVGVTVQAVTEREAAASSLQDAVTSVTWELEAPAGTDVGAVAARLLAAAELPLERVRKGQRARDDVRPQILDLVPAGTTLRAELSTTGRGLRPAELAALAFPDAEPSAIRALRTHQWIEHDGSRREVMTLDGDVPATSAEPVAAPAGAAGA
jgi:radical SAM-linked protein